MSFLTRPSVIFAVIFGCFAVLIPRIFLPLLRSKQSTPAHHPHEHFRQSSLSAMPHRTDDDTIDHTHDSFARMRMRHPGVDGQQPLGVDQISAKPAATFALPMYTVGIAVFFLYTCFKYWTKRNSEENRIKHRYSSNNIQWNTQKKRFKYQVNEQLDDNEEDLYAGLDPEYVEYLRSKRQTEFDAEQVRHREQHQMDNTLDEMKHSLSFISAKLGATQTGNQLTNSEISQLQDRLASTEAQMCKILNALDAASNQVSKLSQSARQSIKQSEPDDLDEDEHRHLSSRSQSASDEDEDEEEDESEENSNPADDEIPPQEEDDDDESSASSYEDEDEVARDEAHGSESESSSERYGLMTTNYECDPSTIDDYELDTIKKPDESTDSRTKVEEWRERNECESLDPEPDQTIPTDT